MKVPGVVLDRRLTFHPRMSAVVRSCSYHAQAIRHICHLPSRGVIWGVYGPPRIYDSKILVSFCQGLTTATLYCMVLRPAASCRSWRVYCTEHCRQATGPKAIRLQASTASAALATTPTADHFQVGCADVQDQQHIHTCHPPIPQPSHHSTRLWAYSAFVCSFTAVCALPQDEFLQTCISTAPLLPLETLCHSL